MDFNEYQSFTKYTAVYPHRGEIMGLAYAALGAAGEAGEVAEKVKKVIRDSDGEVTPERTEAIAAEIGDVLWYLSEVATNLGLNLGDIAQNNVDKLLDRKSRGVLKGDGDTR